MPICVVCNVRFYEDGWYEPGEPCPCGHEIYGESAWQALGWRGVVESLKWRLLWKWYALLDWWYGDDA